MIKVQGDMLLRERAAELSSRLGSCTDIQEGKIFFPSCSHPTYLTLVQKKSLISSNYILSLRTELPIEQANEKEERIQLNRLGKLKHKGISPLLMKIRTKLIQTPSFGKALKLCDLEDFVITQNKDKLILEVNPYGGGYSQVLLPPMRLRIGISKDKWLGCSQLLHKLEKTIIKLL
ncbi:hypothetical protein [Spirochaeta cellobiosiphila]|uniref:hypothetical protein n=1 Tax=Spirochaeta cellobiosiphila TaxID=504483 RepID=UPI00042A064B|nr:hypothetical protein [Spirochaeta cellobiosiphila]